MQTRRALVTGAGGFIGTHLVERLKREGFWVRGVDIERPAFSPSQADEFLIMDLRHEAAAKQACEGVGQVYALAADMGGMGFIASHRADLLHNNLRIDLNTVEAARCKGVQRLFYASSACVYPEQLQEDTQAVPLREADAYPAQPQDAYGWEKLLGERLCLHYQEDYGLEVRIARLHNIFGPRGAWQGGREKAPAALCRKIASAKLTGATEIEIWGDGAQTRSFCYVDDCVEGIRRLMESSWSRPLNVGQSRLISIEALAELIGQIAGVRLSKRYVPGPQGVRGRTSDNTLLLQVLGWEPEVALEDGLRYTYDWVECQVRDSLALEAAVRTSSVPRVEAPLRQPYPRPAPATAPPSTSS